MAKLSRTFSHRNQYHRLQIIWPVGLGLLVLALAIAVPVVMAQSGCVGDPCVFETPTPGPTPTPTSTPGSGTPTAVPMATPMNPFPQSYGVPTSIPLYSFPAVPSPIAVTLPAPTPIDNLTPTPWPIPSVITLTAISGPVTGTEAISLTEISTSLSISYSALMTLSLSGEGVTGTVPYTLGGGLIEDGQGIISDVMSYTNWLTGETAALEYTETLTLATAPDWYAPQLPREMADVGWTFELLSSDIDNPTHYSLNTWATLLGQMTAIPVKLSKTLWSFFRALGPFGLFLIWLLVVMLPAVLGFKILIFIKGLIIKGFNFLLWIIEWLWKIWIAIPFI